VVCQCGLDAYNEALPLRPHKLARVVNALKPAA